MNMNWSNQKANPTLKTKMGQPKSQIDKIQWEQMANRVGIYFPTGDHSATQTVTKRKQIHIWRIFCYGAWSIFISTNEHQKLYFHEAMSEKYSFWWFMSEIEINIRPFLVISLNFDYVQRVY